MQMQYLLEKKKIRDNLQGYALRKNAVAQCSEPVKLGSQAYDSYEKGNIF